MYVLERDGLTLELLKELSYKSNLNLSLKRTLRKIDKNLLMNDLNKANEFYNERDLRMIAVDYRIKSMSSMLKKYNKNIAVGKPVEKVFNDILGFRAMCNSYEELQTLKEIKEFRFVDMSKGKANDDGYRGVHLYFQIDHSHYPIEIQYNTYYDRALNNWLHFYLYKKSYPKEIGQIMRKYYEDGKIRNEKEFKEVLEDVLLDY